MPLSQAGGPHPTSQLGSYAFLSCLSSFKNGLCSCDVMILWVAICNGETSGQLCGPESPQIPSLSSEGGETHPLTCSSSKTLSSVLVLVKTLTNGKENQRWLYVSNRVNFLEHSREGPKNTLRASLSPSLPRTYFSDQTRKEQWIILQAVEVLTAALRFQLEGWEGEKRG